MGPTPAGWPRISQALYYVEAAKAIDFLREAFGFEVRVRIEGPDGRIEHSELVCDGGLVMVGDVAGREEKYPYRRAPSQLGGINTQSLFVYVDDVEAHHARAVAAGARVCSPLATVDYGEDFWSDRGYECEDPGGHHWWFAQRLRDPKPKP